MKSQQTLFVCEFITGGGLAGADLSVSLAREGTLMRNALLNDLTAMRDWQIISSYDARLPPPPNPIQAIAIQRDDDVWAVWQHCMQSADAVWVIAPESDGVLMRLAELANTCQTKWLGPDIEAIKITSNKYLMARILEQYLLPVIATCFYDEWAPNDVDKWVVKPIDGAGCEATYIMDNAQSLHGWFASDEHRKHTHIIQPYTVGVPASISVLGLKDQAIVLSCNLQSIAVKDGQFSYKGGVVNGAVEYWELLSDLANQIHAAIPGLIGYFGIDVILTSTPGQGLAVLEINPRLTTSYVHLHEATGCNPAHLVMQTLLGNTVDILTIQKNKIEFYLEHEV
jgi:predicted ATP-grasp superfamily ATP-dependent carboligase